MLAWFACWSLYAVLCATAAAAFVLRWTFLATFASRGAAVGAATALLAGSLTVRAILLRGTGAPKTRQRLLASAWLLDLVSACAGALACASGGRVVGVSLLAAAGIALAATPPKILGDVASA